MDLRTPPAALARGAARRRPPPRRCGVVAAPLGARPAGVSSASGLRRCAPHFHARDLLHGREVQCTDGTTGTACGVDADGALLVHTAHGLQKISSAEVSVRPIAPTPCPLAPLPCVCFCLPCCSPMRLYFAWGQAAGLRGLGAAGAASESRSAWRSRLHPTPCESSAQPSSKACKTQARRQQCWLARPFECSAQVWTPCAPRWRPPLPPGQLAV